MTQLPSEAGSAEVVRKRAERWSTGGVWKEILRLLDEGSLPPSVQSALRMVALSYAKRGERILRQRSS